MGCSPIKAVRELGSERRETVDLAVLKLGYLLETPSIRHYSFLCYNTEAVKMCSVRTISREGQAMQEVDVATGSYLAGFTDGEGCFYIGVHPTPNVALGIQVVPEFHVSQNGERISVLQLFQDKLGCGLIKRNASATARDQTWVYVVKRHDDLHEAVLPFFTKFPLRSDKQNQFLKFKQVVEMMHRKEHLNNEGLQDILQIAFTMNGSKFRKRTLAQLLDRLEPSETIRRVPAIDLAGEDIVRTA